MPWTMGPSPLLNAPELQDDEVLALKQQGLNGDTKPSGLFSFVVCSVIEGHLAL